MFNWNISVDIASCDLQKMLTNIYIALPSLKKAYNHRGWTISIIPNHLFSRYAELIPLLPPKVLTVSFSLIIFFVIFLSSCKMQYDSKAIFYLIYQIYSYIFC